MKKIISNTLIIVFVIALSSVMAFSAEPVPSAPAKNYNYNPTDSSVSAVTKPEVNEAMNRLKKSIKKETDWLSVRETKTRRTLLEAIGTAKEEISRSAADAVKNSIGGVKKDLTDATSAVSSAAEDLRKSAKLNGEVVGNAVLPIKNAVNGLWLVIVIIGAIILLGLIILGSLVIRSQKKSHAMIIDELRTGSMAENVSEIKEEVSEIKGVVKPDSFTLHFTVAGQEWLYNVPVNTRGKFVSIYAPKVTDPADMPATPADTVRATFSEEKDLAKSCKGAIKEFSKPTCDPLQKALIDHLISTGELRKA